VKPAGLQIDVPDEAGRLETDKAKQEAFEKEFRAENGYM
jgi:hypothetical protein